MKKLFLFFLFYFYFIHLSFGQEIISNAGETTFVNGTEISWSLGEMIVGNSYEGVEYVFQGFHLGPFEESVTSVISNEKKWDVKISPNPSFGRIHLDGIKSQSDLILNVFTLKGEKVLSKKVIIPADIDLENLAPSTYFIQLVGEDQYSFFKISIL